MAGESNLPLGLITHWSLQCYRLQPFSHYISQLKKSKQLLTVDNKVVDNKVREIFYFLNPSIPSIFKKISEMIKFSYKLSH